MKKSSIIIVASLISISNITALFAAESADTQTQVVIPDWITKMKIKGDIRARFEQVDVDGDTHKSRFRGRVRLGVYGDVNDQMDWGIRFASGSDESPTSSNQSLDDFGSKREMWMDLGYFGYRPAELDDLYLVIGKVKKPWKGVSNLIWDSDFNPEGINAQYGFSAVNVQCGYYMMKDNATGDDPQTDVGMFAGQIDSGVKLAEKVKLNAGLAGFFYQNIKDTEVVKSDAGRYLAKGNTINKVEADDGTVTEFWANDYEEIVTFAALDIKRGPLPLKLYGEYVVNIAADTADDDGWKLGFKTSLKKLGLEYNYRDLGRDAVLGLLTDSDFGGGGTGSKGHMIKAKYEILHHCTLGLTLLLADNDIKDVPVDTVQADIVVKF